MRCLLALTVALFLHPSLRAAEPNRESFEYAVDAGLDYLSKFQTVDGAWMAHTSRIEPASKHPAVTALCVMAFLSSGHVPGEGRYGKVVENGIEFVLSHQQKSGVIARPKEWCEMYSHGICTLMLAEAVGMLPDRAAAKRLRERLAPAILVILKSQVRNGEYSGGWRYKTDSIDSDISVTAWQVMALRAAKNVGCDIPAEPIKQATAYIKRCHEPISGGYGYQHMGPVTIPCTGASLLALELTGKEHHGSQEAMKAGAYLLKNPLDPRKQNFFYGVYYTSQAMFQLGDNYWSVYRKDLHNMLLLHCAPKGAGYWDSEKGPDAQFGPNYCTAMAILALTVEYRFLPIYQRDEQLAESEVKLKP